MADTDDICVCHANWGHGGGELVAAELCRTLDAPLVYCYHSRGMDTETPDDVESNQIFEQRDWIAKSPILRDAQYMWSLQRVPELHEHDVVLISGNEFQWYVPRDGQTVVRYAHSTPRNPYDLFHERGKSSVTKLYSMFARVMSQHTIPYADIWVANSDVVAKRLQKYWGVDESDIRIVYPPVDVDSMDTDRQETEDNLYLTYSRLDRTKRVSEIIDAMGYFDDKYGGPRLVVGGTGDMQDEVERKSAKYDNVEYRGYLGEDEKLDLLSRASGLIFIAQNEDFGIVPIESLAAGTPVICADEGMPQYVVKNSKNGYVTEPTVPDVYEAVRWHHRHGVQWSEEEIQEYAEQFSVDEFRYGIREAVQIAISRSQIDPELSIPDSVDAEVSSDD